MPSAMVTASVVDGVVYVEGEIDVASVATLEEILDATDDPLVVDMRAVSFMDCSGLRVLRRLQHDREAGGGVTVVAMSPIVHRVLEIAQILPLLGGEGRVPSAVAASGPQAG